MTNLSKRQWVRRTLHELTEDDLTDAGIETLKRIWTKSGGDPNELRSIYEDVFHEHRMPAQDSWLDAKRHKPDPKLGTILYRIRKSGKDDRWFVGLAYSTVSGNWAIDSGAFPWPSKRGYSLQWMEIPK